MKGAMQLKGMVIEMMTKRISMTVIGLAVISLAALLGAIGKPEPKNRVIYIGQPAQIAPWASDELLGEWATRRAWEPDAGALAVRGAVRGGG